MSLILNLITIQEYTEVGVYIQWMLTSTLLTSYMDIVRILSLLKLLHQ